MTNMDVHYSSRSDNWATPQSFFDRLNNEFNFTLDPCSDKYNAKCSKYFTEEDDGLTKSWEGERVFMNPPYGRVIGDWIRKAYEESLKEGTMVVALIPARTDTRYWHDYVMKADEIRLVKGRLKFGDGRNSAPFPSAVVVFSGEGHTPKLSAMNAYKKEKTSG